MRIEQAQKAKEERKAALVDLTEKSASLSHDLEVFRRERITAVHDFAAGDNEKQKVIHDLDTKIESFALRFEGMQSLIAEAEAQVLVAAADLVKATNEEGAALNAFIAARQAEELEAYIAAIPERLKRIVALYIELGTELGRIQVDCFRYQKCPGVEKIMDLAHGFYYRFNVLLGQEKNVRWFYPSNFLLTVQGCATPTEQHSGPLVSPVEDVIRKVKEQDLARLTDAFYKERNDLDHEGGE
jgi:hypothetical protein